MKIKQCRETCPISVLVVAQELRAYEEYLAGWIDKQAYLKADSRDLIIIEEKFIQDYALWWL